MHPLVKKYLEVVEIYEKAGDDFYQAARALDACDLPDNLREAQPSDIVEGNVIWYKGCSGSGVIKIVEEVRDPSDPETGFSTHDGFDWGLDGAYVEVEEETVPGFDAEILAKALEGCVELMAELPTLNGFGGLAVWDNARESLDQYYKAQEIA